MVCLAPTDTRICGRVYVEAVVALELRDDRVLQFGDALDRRVSRCAVPDRFDAGFGDVRGRVEVGLADAETDDVVALGLELGHATRQGDGGRGFDALDTVGEYGGHGIFSGGW